LQTYKAQTPRTERKVFFGIYFQTGGSLSLFFSHHTNGRPWEGKVRLLRIKQVLEIVPVSKSTLWQWVKVGKFPTPIKRSRCTFWIAEDVQKFIEDGSVTTLESIQV
jgi:predicted DNA-binding transcriptional regulator AlpA